MALIAWFLALARFAGMFVLRAIFDVRARMRARARRVARESARALIDCARARYAVANIGDATYDVTGIYNYLVDQGAMSTVRMRALVAEALVDEVDEGAIENGVVIARLGWQHEGIIARMPFGDNVVTIDACNDIRA